MHMDRQKTAFACEPNFSINQEYIFFMCNTSVTFQRAMAPALQRMLNRENSIVLAHIDDNATVTERTNDHLIDYMTCLPKGSRRESVSVTS